MKMSFLKRGWLWDWNTLQSRMQNILSCEVTYTFCLNIEETRLVNRFFYNFKKIRNRSYLRVPPDRAQPERGPPWPGGHEVALAGAAEDASGDGRVAKPEVNISIYLKKGNSTGVVALYVKNSCAKHVNQILFHLNAALWNTWDIPGWMSALYPS